MQHPHWAPSLADPNKPVLFLSLSSPRDVLAGCALLRGRTTCAIPYFPGLVKTPSPFVAVMSSVGFTDLRDSSSMDLILENSSHQR